LFQTLADTENRNSAQVNAMLGLKICWGKKVKRKADKEDSDRDTN